MSRVVTMSSAEQITMQNRGPWRTVWISTNPSGTLEGLGDRIDGRPGRAQAEPSSGEKDNGQRRKQHHQQHSEPSARSPLDPPRLQTVGIHPGSGTAARTMRYPGKPPDRRGCVGNRISPAEPIGNATVPAFGDDGNQRRFRSLRLAPPLTGFIIPR